MKITSIFTLFLSATCFACCCLAENHSDTLSKVPATETSAGMHDLVSSARAAAATGNSEVFHDIVIEAGKTVSFDSTLDYSSAGIVAISVLCTLCTTSETSLSTSGLILQARWMVQNADSYVATDYRVATAFPYWDAGGAEFSVYGSQFRLTLQNKGSKKITLAQITIFLRSQ